MSITTEFIHSSFGTLNVYDEGVHIIHQPFKPMPDGSFGTWTEEEALEWWFKERSTLIDRTKYEINSDGEIVKINTGRQ